MARPFLTARWSNLTLLNYQVPDSLIASLCPPGCEPDLWEGHAYVSLVGFDFEQVRVLGLPWLAFPEINLRFYVRYGEERGVVFVRELVPSRIVSSIARWLYNEPYRRVPMTSRVDANSRSITVERCWWSGKFANSIRMAGSAPSVEVGESTVEHFFKEHQWGFGVSRSNRLLRYEVRHPKWRIFPVTESSVDVDWEASYGGAFGFLTNRTPDSVAFAEGSLIEVYSPSRG